MQVFSPFCFSFIKNKYPCEQKLYVLFLCVVALATYQGPEDFPVQCDNINFKIANYI